MNQPPPPPAQQHQTMQQGVAATSLELEKMRLRLLAWRIAGFVVGIAIAFALAMVGQDVVALVALFTLPALGLYLGGIVGLASMR